MIWIDRLALVWVSCWVLSGCDDPKPALIAQCSMDAARALPSEQNARSLYAPSDRNLYVRDCMRVAGYRDICFTASPIPVCFEPISAWAKIQKTVSSWNR